MCVMYEYSILGSDSTVSAADSACCQPVKEQCMSAKAKLR